MTSRERDAERDELFRLPDWHQGGLQNRGGSSFRGECRQWEPSLRQPVTNLWLRLDTRLLGPIHGGPEFTTYEQPPTSAGRHDLEQFLG